MHQAVAAVGYFVMIFLAWLMSTHRRRFPWRIVIGGTFLQLLLAWAILNTYAGLRVFTFLGSFFTRVIGFVDAGCTLVFGESFHQFYFAFRVLPTIIFFSALMSIFYHLGIIQRLVRLIGRLMELTLRTSGAESLSASANIFVGQTEAPLVIRPYVARMTKSELMSVMVGGFATIAGSVMAAYVGMGIDAAHLITASAISAPAGLLIAKVLQPETEIPETLGGTAEEVPRTTSNLIEAATSGASDGLHLALNVGAMLIAFMSLIALLDYGTMEVSKLIFVETGLLNEPFTLTAVLGQLFAPVGWLMGIEWKQCHIAGELLGLKLVATEFVAYEKLGSWMQMDAEGRPLSDRAAVILTYALCGFANVPSIGIQIGGIGAMAPERRRELTQIAFRAMLGGALACCMTACLAGILWTPATNGSEPAVSSGLHQDATPMSETEAQTEPHKTSSVK